MTRSKNRKNHVFDCHATLTCECGEVVRVGTGGQGNLVQHRKSVKHQDAMARTMYGKIKNVKAFFSPFLARLKHTIARLPSTVPEATPNDLIYMFSSLPALDSIQSSDKWEILDPILSQFLGFGKSIHDIKCEIRTGSYGTDGLYNWVSFCITKGVAEEKLERKLAPLINAMNDLIKGNEVDSDSTPTSLATSEFRVFSPEVIDVDAIDTSAQLSLFQETTPESAPNAIDADGLCEIVNDDAIPTRTKDSPLQCHGFEVHSELGRSVHGKYPFHLHGRFVLPWSFRGEKEKLTLHAENCEKLSDADPCVNCRALDSNEMLSGILQRMLIDVTEDIPWMWLSHDQLEKKVRELETELRDLEQLARRKGNPNLVLFEPSGAISELSSSLSCQMTSGKATREERFESSAEEVITGNNKEKISDNSQEICDCGMGEKSMCVSKDDSGGWTDASDLIKDLIKCQAVGCEIGVFHLDCQGLKSVPLNWMCKGCKAMNRKTAKRPRN